MFNQCKKKSTAWESDGNKRNTPKNSETLNLRTFLKILARFFPFSVKQPAPDAIRGKTVSCKQPAEVIEKKKNNQTSTWREIIPGLLSG